jgi:hypothetical protein
MIYYCTSRRGSLRFKSGQNSFRTLEAASKPSCTANLPILFPAVRPSGWYGPTSGDSHRHSSTLAARSGRPTYAERWVQSVREKCLSKLTLFSEFRCGAP